MQRKTSSQVAFSVTLVAITVTTSTPALLAGEPVCNADVPHRSVVDGFSTASSSPYCVTSGIGLGVLRLGLDLAGQVDASVDFGAMSHLAGNSDVGGGTDGNTIILGEIDPPGTFNGASSMAFDGALDPLVADLFGTVLWRLDIRDASLVTTYPMSIGPAAMRGLTFDPDTGVYYVTRLLGSEDHLTTLNHFTGSAVTIGPSGFFNFLDMEVDRSTGELWLVNDCANPNCTLAGGGEIGTLDPATGAYTAVYGFGTSLGQITSLAIRSDGKFLVAALDNFGLAKIYQIDPISGDAIPYLEPALGFVSILKDIDIDPSTGVLFGIEERRGATPRTWHLVQLTAPNQPPIADAGLDRQSECSSSAGAMLTLDGSASSDADSTPGTNDDIVAFEWFENFGLPTENRLGVGEMLDLTLPLGSHVITLRVTDEVGQTDTDEVVAAVVDTSPPEISVALDPEILWPPNHHMIDVTASVSATDNCGMPMVVLTTVESNEEDNGEGDGNTFDDIQDADLGGADYQFKLRAERAGGGDGRIYTAIYTATDESGNPAAEAGFVVVPHDQGDVVEPIDAAVDQNASGTVVTWTADLGAQTYDVIRGDLSHIAEMSWVINLGAVTCIEDNSDDLNTLGWEDSVVPAPGEAFFYLVEYFDGTSGSYGTESGTRPRTPGPGDCD